MQNRWVGGIGVSRMGRFELRGGRRLGRRISGVWGYVKRCGRRLKRAVWVTLWCSGEEVRDEVNGVKFGLGSGLVMHWE
jgi:hypothetical protein